METIENSIVINAPVEKVFEYIDNPLNDPEWLIGMIEVNEVEGLPGVGRHFHWTFKMVGLPLKGQSTTIEHVPDRRTVTESQGGISSTWAADVGDGREDDRRRLSRILANRRQHHGDCSAGKSGRDHRQQAANGFGFDRTIRDHRVDLSVSAFFW